MGLQLSDQVRTKWGEEGKVVYISRLTVFVALQISGEGDTIKGYLESELTKIDPTKYDPTATRANNLLDAVSEPVSRK